MNEDQSFLDEIDAAFEDLTNEAKANDAELDSISAEIKAVTKSFNMSRYTLSRSALGTTYMQGMPGEEACRLIMDGGVSLDKLLPHFIASGALRFKDTRKSDKQAPGYLDYRGLCLAGSYGEKMLQVYMQAADVDQKEAITILLGPKPTKEYVESLKGITFAKGVKEYVASVRTTLTEIANRLPEGTDPIKQIYPDDTLARGQKELEELLRMDFAKVEDEL